MNTKLSYDEVIDCLALHNGNVKTTAEKLNVKYITLISFIRKNHIPYISKKQRLPSKEKIQELYSELGSLSLVAKELNCTKEGVRAVMKRNMIHIKPLVKHSCDENFFDIKNECESQFYWAGFIAADGCLIHKKSKSLGSFQLQISLAEKDTNHLEKFKNDIGSTAKVAKYLVKNSKRNSEWNDTTKCHLGITSKKIFDDLSRFNITPAKTKTYDMPEWLIQHKMVNHFMRGYFDGDGSFYKLTKKNRITPQLYFSIRGNLSFLDKYRQILNNNCDNIESFGTIRVNSGIGLLEYGGNNICKRLVNYLYNNSNIYLNRKHEIIKELILPSRS